MKFTDIPVMVDSRLPSGSMLLRSEREQGVIADLVSLGDRIDGDPALAEDCASLMESAPFFIRYREGTAPIRCECCGVPVTMVPEASADDPPPRTWTQAIWEHGTGRKHTLRRCTWIRDHAC